MCGQVFCIVYQNLIWFLPPQYCCMGLFMVSEFSVWGWDKLGISFSAITVWGSCHGCQHGRLESQPVQPHQETLFLPLSLCLLESNKRCFLMFSSCLHVLFCENELLVLHSYYLSLLAPLPHLIAIFSYFPLLFCSSVSLCLLPLTAPASALLC